MLTRLEVSGFKNLLDMSVEFGPFTCIAGENGTGKSNIFDSIQFLSLLADVSMMEAAQQVRGVQGERVGDPRDLFWNGYDDSERRMRFAAEMILPVSVEDDFGRFAQPTISFVRYSVELGYRPPSRLDKVGRLALLSENLTHINQRDAPSHLRFPHSVNGFRQKVLFGRRSGTAFISTSIDRGEPVVSIHQDGGSRGQPRPAAAARAPATVVSTVTSSDDPTILATRREMQSWRRLALEPSALRASDGYSDPKIMTANGAHMAGSLYRVATLEGGDEDRDKIYARVAARLSDLSGIRVNSLTVDEDDSRELFTIQLEEAPGLRLPARSLSEGTLRFLALCVMLEDPEIEGLICMEEPENGIHPGNLEAMVDLVRDLAVDTSSATGPDNPFRQVIVNTHSPYLVRLIDPDNLLFASNRLSRAPDGSITPALDVRPLVDTWRARDLKDPTRAVTRADILPYLLGPPSARLSLQEA